MDKPIIADSISYLPEFRAWYAVIKETLAEIDLGQLLVYIIDTVDTSALPYLAEQFDVLGYKGFKLANTEVEQREILKRAIELHRYKGTEWAIREAMKSIGFENVVIKKGIAGGYDHWAKFGLNLSNASRPITASSFYDLMQMVVEYKRAVCVLMDITIDLTIDDVLDLSEDTADINESFTMDDELNLSGGLMYDGDGQYDGEYDHSGDTDIVTFD